MLPTPQKKYDAKGGVYRPPHIIPPIRRILTQQPPPIQPIPTQQPPSIRPIPPQMYEFEAIHPDVLVQLSKLNSIDVEIMRSSDEVHHVCKTHQQCVNLATMHLYVQVKSDEKALSIFKLYLFASWGNKFIKKGKFENYITYDETTYQKTLLGIKIRSDIYDFYINDIKTLFVSELDRRLLDEYITFINTSSEEFIKLFTEGFFPYTVPNRWETW